MFGFRPRGGIGTRFLVSRLYPQARRDSTRVRKERHRRLWVSFLPASLIMNFNKQASSIMGVTQFTIWTISVVNLFSKSP